jgi:hypothetical protein
MPAKQRIEENSPQRHRGHRDDPEVINELGFGLILRALRASVVRIHAKQSQSRGEAMSVNCCPERTL